jgi:hypothetical protein
VHGVVTLSVGLARMRAESDKPKTPPRDPPVGWSATHFTFAPTVLAGGPAPARALVVGGAF